MRVLLTGAAGGVASLLCPRLARTGRTLRLLDLRAPAFDTDDTEIIVGSINDPDVIGKAMHGVDAVVHLGGQSREAPVDTVLQANMLGTYRVLDAAYDEVRHARARLSPAEL